jgi:hypothetical protein
MLNVAETKTTKATSSRAKDAPETAPAAAPAPVAVAPAKGIAIAKGVALPDASRVGGGSTKYPWATMVPGDAFFVAGAKIETFYSLTSTAKKKHGHNFVARKCKGGLFGQADVDGVGVWCLELNKG